VEEESYAKPWWAKALGLSTSGNYGWLKERDSQINRKEELRPYCIQVFKEDREG
jgi:hypothetical protein